MVKYLETKADFDQFLEENKDVLVVIDFTAAWCGPCKVIAPEFEKLNEKFPKVALAKVDVDENEETAQDCGISAMPTFILFANKEKVDSMTGANKQKLEETIKKHYK